MKRKVFFMMAAAGFLLAACGSGGGGGAASGVGASAGGGASGAAFNLSGVVTKGPMDKSTIQVAPFPANPKAILKKVFAANQVAVATSKNGKVTISLGNVNKKKILVAVSDAGSYTDEATGKVVSFQKGQGFHAIILPGETSFTISPLSELAYQLAIKAWRLGMPAKVAVMKGRGFALRMFGVHASSVPGDPLNLKSTNLEAMKYAGILAGFSQILQSPSLKSLRGAKSTDFDFYTAIISDMEDGVLDGKNGATSIIIPGLRSSLPVLGGVTFKSAITTFVAAHPNFNPKGISIPFRAPAAVLQPAIAKKGYLSVKGIPNAGVGCSTANTSGCSSGVSIPLLEMIPSGAIFTAPAPKDPKQFDIIFQLPGLFKMTLSSISILPGSYVQSCFVNVNRYDVNGASVWSSTGGGLLTHGIAVDVVARTVTFTNTKMYFVPDVYSKMDTMVLNGVLRF